MVASVRTTPAGAIFDQANQGRGWKAVLDQLVGDQRQSFRAHVNNDGLARPRQHRPVERQFAVLEGTILQMPGDEDAGLGMVAVDE